MPSLPEPGDGERRLALIHREIFQLCALVAIAVVAFLLTRAVAASNRDMGRQDAAEWFRRGQQALSQGQTDDAIDALRRATVRDRGDNRYMLALARALASKGDEDSARAVLLTLREADPENRDINLELARLAAAQQDVTAAVRFFHNALYAPWPFEQAGARRAVRLELIRFMLAHGQATRAVGELLALSADLPPEAPPHLEVARLFAAAGDDAHALAQFQRVLEASPDDPTAIAGAGMAAFRLGDYALARTYLRRAPANAGDLQTAREVADLVLSRDPLAARIGSAERRRRLIAGLADVGARLDGCLARGAAGSAAAPLADEARAFEAPLSRPGALEQDTVEAGVELIDRIEQEIAVRCGPSTPLDQAFALIGRRHGASAR